MHTWNRGRCWATSPPGTGSAGCAWESRVTDTGRRNPAVTAQAAASLHLLTRGRAVLGIGTGERESNAPYGVDWSKPVARFEEAVATIRALWNSNGELVTRDSPFFPLHQATFALPPYEGKWPEIWIAAHGPRMMRATGRHADGWFPGTTRGPNTVSNSRSCVPRLRMPAATQWP
jgi:phthiodiolone/phenolphthiodiolone dimycocerosates ketoreductase